MKKKLGLKKVVFRDLDDATLVDMAGANGGEETGAPPPTGQGTCEASCPQSCNGTCNGTCQGTCPQTCNWCPSSNCYVSVGSCGTCQYTCPNTGF